MSNDAGKDWEQEYREFLDSAETPPPPRLSERVRATVLGELNPSPYSVFVRLLIISTISGLLSLIVCPQFGFGSNMALMRFFMKFGPQVCSMACGAFFIGVGAILSSIYMRPEELRVLRRTKYLQFAALSMLLLSGFICTSGAVVSALTLFWILGAFFGALLSFELSYRFRFAAV